MGVQSEDKFDCSRMLRCEIAKAGDITRPGVQKVRNDVTFLGSDLTRIGELGRLYVCQHYRSHWTIVLQVGDPESCDRLIVWTTSERHLHHPIGVGDEIVASFHDVRNDLIHETKLILEK